MAFFYLIMPSAAHPGTGQKRRVVDELAEQHGLDVHHPRYGQANHSFDLPSALRAISDAAFVVADLSLERPSCYYELGLAEAADKHVYLVAEAGTVIHQSSHRDTVFYYSSTEALAAHLRAVIKEWWGAKDDVQID